MADDLDKFVLQYQVELKDSLRRLEELNDKIDATNKRSQEGRKKDSSEAKKAEKEKAEAQKREAKQAEADAAKKERDKKALDKRERDESAKQEKERKDAQRRKEKAQEEANKKAKKASQEAMEGVKGIAGEASGELARLVPGVDKVTTSVMGMTTAFGLASAAVAILGAGIGSVMSLKEQYEKQRQVGMDVGVSAPRLEEYQRKFQKYGEGRVSRDQTLENVNKISQVRSAAYADPTRMGEQSRLLRMIGIDVGRLGEKPIAMNELMAKLGQKFASSTEAQAQAIGNQFGLSQDFTSALRKMGGSVGEVTETSEDELKNRQQTNKNLDKFNESLAKMNEELLKAGNAIAEHILPYLTKITNFVGGSAKELPTVAEESSNAMFEFGGPAKILAGAAGALKDKITGKGEFWDSYKKRRGIGEYSPEEIAKQKARKEEKEKETKENGGVEKNVGDLMDAADKNNQNNKTAIDQFQLAINMFAGSVSSFANAVDERQAWAAWAGEVGKAAGLGAERTQGGPGKPGQAEETAKQPSWMGTSKFDSFFEEAGKRYNVPASMLKKISTVESSLDPTKVSKVGAQGLMQVMPENSRKLGVKDPFDPRSNIMAGAQIFSENLKRAKGDYRQALMMYHGGLDRDQWGPLTLAYPDKVMRAGEVSARGESRANINLNAVQQNIAQRLGVPLQQIQTGGVTKGDVTWTANQKEAELQNKLIDLHRQEMTAGLPKTEYDRIAREKVETQMGIESMRRYRGDVEEKAKPGDRQLTVGQIPVYVNVTASGTPEEIQKHIRENVSMGVQDAINATNNGRKL